MQTTVHFETKDLVDTDIPIFISFVAHPGFDPTCLKEFGFGGDFDIALFLKAFWEGLGCPNPRLFEGNFEVRFGNPKHRFQNRKTQC